MADIASARNIRVAIAAGGTGGHIMPALALAEALRRHGGVSRVDFFCGNRTVELAIYSQAAVSPSILPMGPMTAGGPVRRIAQGWNTLRGFARVLREIGRYDVVVGMGGYVAGPVLLAACLRRIPFVVHDSNTLMGRVNRWMARWAAVVACGLPLVRVPKGVQGERILLTGTPVRRAVASCDREEGARNLKLDPAAFTLLITGGSQGGSRTFANLLLDALQAMDTRWPGGCPPLQVAWTTGQANRDYIEAELNQRGVRFNRQLLASLDRMEWAYAASDIVLGRAGGSTLAEVLNCGLPSILFPLPISAEDHQRFNARVLVDGGAAMVFDEKIATADEVADCLLALAADPRQIARMRQAALALALPNADDELARRVVAVAAKVEAESG